MVHRILLPDTPDEVDEEPPMPEGSAKALEESATASKGGEEKIYLELAKKRQSRGQTQSHYGWADGYRR
jgi:hypothetical protein